MVTYIRSFPRLHRLYLSRTSSARPGVSSFCSPKRLLLTASLTPMRGRTTCRARDSVVEDERTARASDSAACCSPSRASAGCSARRDRACIPPRAEDAPRHALVELCPSPPPLRAAPEAPASAASACSRSCPECMAAWALRLSTSSATARANDAVPWRRPRSTRFSRWYWRTGASTMSRAPWPTRARGAIGCTAARLWGSCSDRCGHHTLPTATAASAQLSPAPRTIVCGRWNSTPTQVLRLRICPMDCPESARP
mmetsp:Transcript_8549/g.25172  ORF Transcript_8549/g.25172 Transcript_8549/m.25172 type:complete len:255 (-) Transcript_8549:1088-1852(-)